jgi:alpha-beta hydrolase superfamily lysophospholipase
LSEPRIESWTASDGYEWKFRRYPPQGTPRGEIVSIHGIQSHSGWYDQSSRDLASHGWGVSALDRRGSGLNEQARGDCPSFRRLLDDIAEYLVDLKKRTHQPIVMQGISWGGKLALAFQKRHRRLCDGLILIGPGFRPKVRMRAIARLTILFQRLIRPNLRLPIPLMDPELFTANPKRQQYIRDDALALRDATTRFLFESRRLDIYSRIARKHVRGPVLLLLAGNDRIIQNKKTIKFLRKCEHANTSTITYPTAHHTLEFEPDGPVHGNDMNQWLEHKFGKV